MIRRKHGSSETPIGHGAQRWIKSSAITRNAALFALGCAETAAAGRSLRLRACASSRVFPTSRYAIDEILARPFRSRRADGLHGRPRLGHQPSGLGVSRRRPLDRLDASHGVRPRDPRRARPAAAQRTATYYPSHIHYEGTVRKEMTASASFTFALDSVENPLSRPFEPNKRWTCWSSGRTTGLVRDRFGNAAHPRRFRPLFLRRCPDRCLPPPGIVRGPVLRRKIRHVDASSAAEGDFPSEPKPGENRVRFEPVRSPGSDSSSTTPATISTPGSTVS